MHFVAFIFGLVVIGGLATLVAIGDPHNSSRLTLYVGFTALFAGLGAASLSMILALIGAKLFESEPFTGLGFFGGYIVGGFGGAAFGFYRALLRRRRIDAEVHEVDAFD
jgi:hypothetical protein